MKQFAALPIIAFFLAIPLSARPNQYPFDVKISGKGKQAIIFIPGFASSGDEDQ
jgi:hypothetical protein